MINPHGRVILVSGASRGIGFAVAQALYAKGYTVSLGVRDPASLQPAIAHWSELRLHTAHYEATDWKTHAAWVESVVERFGRVDGLVNNAGIGSKGTIRTIEEAELDRIWAVNCKAPLNLIREALPHLEAGGRGRIVNIASLSGKRVRNDNVAYNMSKFAMLALTHSVRRLGWEKGVRSTALCPSFVRSDMTAGTDRIAPELMSDPADIAELVATLIALPNTASVAELLVNCRLEDMV
ncbi:NADP-dependent 3-hydroxy acid dehydrogenase YdfG [Rhizobiales bacterium GAS188]|nr:NADP-dependent 3-hydroxy acid dehydrogenase YdfG [Rhizobiales bacterium GAS188]